MSGTFEEDDMELRKYFEGPRKKNTDPNLVEDLAYRMRFAKGVVWHSWVDPNRPDSPPVEWPEYPKDERPDDIPDDGILSHPTDPKVEAAANRSGGKATNPYKPIKGTPDEPCGPTNRPLESPESSDEIIDSIHTPDFPGLYPGEGYSPWGGGGARNYDSEDDYNY